LTLSSLRRPRHGRPAPRPRALHPDHEGGGDRGQQVSPAGREAVPRERPGRGGGADAGAPGGGHAWVAWRTVERPLSLTPCSAHRTPRSSSRCPTASCGASTSPASPPRGPTPSSRRGPVAPINLGTHFRLPCVLSRFPRGTQGTHGRRSPPAQEPPCKQKALHLARGPNPCQPGLGRSLCSRVCSAAAQGPRAPPPCVSLRPEGPLLGNSRLMSPGSACWERNRDSGPGPGLPRTLNYQCWEVTSRSLLGVSNSPGGPGVPRSMHGWGMPSSCGRGRLGTRAQAGAKHRPGWVLSQVLCTYPLLLLSTGVGPRSTGF
jgi:hypothetical protein